MILSAFTTASGSTMLQQIEGNPASEHQLYLVLFITSAGGV
jgi:hypothetical protein